MKLLIIGSGGREHAIGWKILKDNPDTQLFFAPGNAGTADLGENIDVNTIDELLNFAKKEKIQLTLVGPEALLVEGIVDAFQKESLEVFGPNKNAAKLEGSKAFAKKFMKKHGIKTAKYETFNNSFKAIDYLKTQTFPIVVKASGLAAGKGVIICQDYESAEKAVNEIMEDKTFGDAGNEVVIEAFLKGFEVSILSIFNGKEITPFISAKDHKKIGEGETGLNTGGMGVISPNPLYTETHKKAFNTDILETTLKGLIKDDLLFSGVIFFGLMINENGVYLLEYNLRMGDPETQTILPLLKSNLLNAIIKSNKGESVQLEWSNQHSCCVVMASGGYPLNYEKGFEINGLDKIEVPNFIAGAIKSGDKTVTSGGRVLNVVGLGNDLDDARDSAYQNIRKINFDYEYYREDIGII
jgi:phosphoribosylamine--glycine ligase